MDYSNYIQALIALVAVLGLITALAWGARRMGWGGVRTGLRRDRRLAIAEVLPLDNRRKLVLIRRDQVEHLVLIGGGDDIVIERAIQPGLPSGLPRVFQEIKP